MKNTIDLILPEVKYLASYLQNAYNYKKQGITSYDFTFKENEDIFEFMHNYREGINLPKGYVKATYFWLVDGHEFLGEIAIRHALTENLKQYGGHIGYGVAYGKMNLGYGTLMLNLALKEAKALELSRVLITCDDLNIASSRVIEKNGGVLQDKITHEVEGKTRVTRRYWINL